MHTYTEREWETVCVCVCVWGRESESERDWERDTQISGYKVCAFVILESCGIRCFPQGIMSFVNKMLLFSFVAK